jgi:hypothetical protein
VWLDFEGVCTEDYPFTRLENRHIVRGSGLRNGWG